MTGFGEAQAQQDGLAVAVELRTVNNKYLKLSLRAGDGYGQLEPEIETLVRQHIKRGAVQLNLRAQRARAADDYRLNMLALASYREQADRLRREWKLTTPVEIGALLSLPGIVDEEPQNSRDVAADWPLIERVITAALKNMAQMRESEGRAMSDDLAINCATIRQELGAIASRAPLVVENYRANQRATAKSVGRRWGRVSTLGYSTRAVPLHRAKRYLGRDRAAGKPLGSVRHDHPSRRKLRSEARIRHPGNVSRDEHDRVESQRLRDFAACHRDQDRDRTHSRNDPKHRVTRISGASIEPTQDFVFPCKLRSPWKGRRP